MKVNHALAMALNEMKKQENDDWHINHHDESCGYDKNWKCLELLTVAELSRALYVGYEIEPEFKVGDWVVELYEKEPRILIVTGSGNVISAVDEHKNMAISNAANFRHAAPEEIEQEKNRRIEHKLDNLLLDLSNDERIRLFDKLGCND